jgi:hypothetical protein
MEPIAGPRLPRFRPSEARRGPHPVLTDPARLTMLVGALVVIVGTLTSWVEVWLPARGWFDLGAFTGSDGGIALELGLVVLFFAWNEWASQTRLGEVIFAPLVFGILILLELRLAHSGALDYLASLRNSGGHGFILPGFWVTVAGGVLVVAGSIVRVWRRRHDMRWALHADWSLIGGTAGAVVGAIAGFVAGVTVANRLTEGGLSGVTGSVVVPFALAFMFFGAAAGAWIGNALTASTRARS